MTIIDAAIDRSRAVIMVLLVILLTGTISYINIPKEDSPDVKIPIIYVSISHKGISPEDGERLLVKPMEKELRGIDGVKEIRSTAVQGQASVILEFNAGFDSNTALQDVREKVDLVKPDLPADADEPTVNEVNLSLFPVISVIMTGNIPERAFIKLAHSLQDEIESIPEVLSVDIAGDREETVEVIIKPLMLESYQLTSEIINFVTRNNLLVAAGSMDTGEGRYQVKVPGLVEGLKEIINLPIKVNENAVVTIGDIASVKKSFRDPVSFARMNGVSAIALEVSKRTGENIIETIERVRSVVAEEKQHWPEGVDVAFAQDRSGQIVDMIYELQNNILFATILVVLVLIWFIGVRAAGFVAIAIPGSFLIGILVISFLGMTLNIVVLFSLILSIGMLVDSAIIVTEYANRKMIEGMSHKAAYGEAAKRMAWPIIASTITTLLVFAPLLFWPGIMGQFMKYLPMTLIATLSGSLLMALIFIPTLGSIMGKADSYDEPMVKNIEAGESGDINLITGFTGWYISILNLALENAGKFVILILLLITGIFFAYKGFGVGTEFFPSVEPDNAQILIRARGNLSIVEKDKLVREVEKRILPSSPPPLRERGEEESPYHTSVPLKERETSQLNHRSLNTEHSLSNDIKVFYVKSGEVNSDQGLSEDVIGIIQLEYHDWKVRRKSVEILAEIRERTSDLAGIIIEVQEQEGGPPSGKPIHIEITSESHEFLAPTANIILNELNKIPDLEGIEHSLPIPAIEWEMVVNKAQAARFGVDMAIVGNFVKLVTTGLKVTSYRPDDNDDEVDVLLRFPKEHRGLEELDRLRAVVDKGAIPLSNFIERKAKQKISKINRVDSEKVITIKSDVKKGVLASNKREEVKELIAKLNLDPKIKITFKGEEENQKETSDFLAKAFVMAIAAIALVLLIQFNNIYHTLIILSAIFLSTGGVLLGLLVTFQPFGIVMCGVGTIALAGIVVNNNIIFIDTYNHRINSGMDVKEALLRTGAQRMRPILLTAGTTVLGLIPMVTAMNIDLFKREVFFGAPSTQWWQQLSTAIAGGLSFATILTLLLTPCLLMLGSRFSGILK